MRHVWEEQQEMKKLLQRLSDHVPTVAQKLEEHEVETGKTLSDHEHRIRALESRMWRLFGALGLIAFAAPFLARMIP
jgi:hypothetical protein